MRRHLLRMLVRREKARRRQFQPRLSTSLVCVVGTVFYRDWVGASGRDGWVDYPQVQRMGLIHTVGKGCALFDIYKLYYVTILL
jgi:hypothetical protein